MPGGPPGATGPTGATGVTGPSGLAPSPPPGPTRRTPSEFIGRTTGAGSPGEIIQPTPPNLWDDLKSMARSGAAYVTNSLPDIDLPSIGPPTKLFISKDERNRDVQRARAGARYLGEQLRPDWQDVFQYGGGTIGGVVGGAAGLKAGVPREGAISGAMLGAGAGQGLYDLLLLASGDPTAPKSYDEFQHRAIDAGMFEGLTSAIPVMGEEVGRGLKQFANLIRDPVALNQSIRKYLREKLYVRPETLATRSLNPQDIFFQDYVRPGLRELKEAEKAGMKSGTVEQAIPAMDRQWRVINQQIEEGIVRPQEHLIVPGSREGMREAQIAAIPSQIRRGSDLYQSNVDRIDSMLPDRDYTIGELNQLRADLGKANSAVHRSKLGPELQADVGYRATELARENKARELFYTGMDTYGLGGGQAARDLNQRVATTIHWTDALQAARNNAVASQLPAFQRFARRASFATSRGVGVRGGLNLGGTASLHEVDRDLKLALKRFDELPPPVAINLQPRTPVIRGAQGTLPVTPGGTQYPPATREGFQPMPFVEGPSPLGGIEVPAGRTNAPPAVPEGTLAGTQRPLFGIEPTPPPGTQYPEEQPFGFDEMKELFEQEMRRRRMWSEATPGQVTRRTPQPDVDPERLSLEEYMQQFATVPDYPRPFIPTGPQGPTRGVRMAGLPKGQLDVGTQVPPRVFWDRVPQPEYRWEPSERETWTLKDLVEARAEVLDYLRTPNLRPETRRYWMGEVRRVSQEIHARVEAQKTPSAKSSKGAEPGAPPPGAPPQ